MESARLCSGDTDSPKRTPSGRGVTVTQVPACPESGGMLSVSKGAVPVFDRRACGECKWSCRYLSSGTWEIISAQTTLFLSAPASSSPSHCVSGELTVANCLTEHKRRPLTHFSSPQSCAHDGNLFVNRRATGGFEMSKASPGELRLQKRLPGWRRQRLSSCQTHALEFPPIEEVDGSSSCTQSTPFLSPAAVSGLRARGLFGLLDKRYCSGRAWRPTLWPSLAWPGLALRQPETDPLTKGQLFDPPRLLLLFCFRAAFLWGQFIFLFSLRYLQWVTALFSTTAGSGSPYSFFLLFFLTPSAAGFISFFLS